MSARMLFFAMAFAPAFTGAVYGQVEVLSITPGTVSFRTAHHFVVVAKPGTFNGVNCDKVGFSLVGMPGPRYPSLAGNVAISNNFSRIEFDAGVNNPGLYDVMFCGDSTTGSAQVRFLSDVDWRQYLQQTANNKKLNAVYNEVLGKAGIKNQIESLRVDLADTKGKLAVIANLEKENSDLKIRVVELEKRPTPLTEDQITKTIYQQVKPLDTRIGLTETAIKAVDSKASINSANIRSTNEQLAKLARAVEEDASKHKTKRILLWKKRNDSKIRLAAEAAAVANQTSRSLR